MKEPRDIDDELPPLRYYAPRPISIAARNSAIDKHASVKAHATDGCHSASPASRRRDGRRNAALASTSSILADAHGWPIERFSDATARRNCRSGDAARVSVIIHADAP